LHRYPNGGFIVPAEALAFSVVAFTVVALAAIAILMFRRAKYGGELGGPKAAQLRDAAILTVLWVLFIVVSVVRSVSS